MEHHEGQPRRLTSLDLTTQFDPAGRQYSDANGVSWRVREMRRADRPPALYFESDGAFRRVTDYPSEWGDLTSAELERLSHSR